MLFLVCIYVIQINSLVSSTYEISRYEKAFQTLSQEARILQAEQSAIRSFKTIEELATVMEFERVARVQYLQSAGAVVARALVQ